MQLDPSEVILACGHVVRAERPVRLVVHHRDGMWQMTCGETDHPEDGGGAAPLHAAHLFERQPDLLTLPNIPAGQMAEQAHDDWLILDHDD